MSEQGATMNMLAEIKTPQGYTLGSLAREALLKNGNDPERATMHLVSSLSGNNALLRAVIRDAINQAAYRPVQSRVETDRPLAIRSNVGRRSVVALASVVSSSLLDMPLYGGLLLRDATRAEVADQADRYAQSATDAAHKAKWLQAIAQSLPAGKRVREVLTEERAAELYAETA